MLESALHPEKEPHHGRTRHAKEMRAPHLFLFSATGLEVLQRILRKSGGD
jgi:hypothetical protein